MADLERNELEMIDWISGASYRDLVEKWHGARVGDPYFKGPVGYYFIETLQRRRREVGDAEHVKVYQEFGIPLGMEGLGGDDA